MLQELQETQLFHSFIIKKDENYAKLTIVKSRLAKKFIQSEKLRLIFSIDI